MMTNWEITVIHNACRLNDWSMNMTFTAIKSWKKSMMIMALIQAALATGGELTGRL